MSDNRMNVDDCRLVGQPPFSAAYIDPPKNKSKKLVNYSVSYLFPFHIFAVTRKTTRTSFLLMKNVVQSVKKRRAKRFEHPKRTTKKLEKMQAKHLWKTTNQ